MILGFFTLLVAVLISTVSAYYSISGLVAIFPAAAVPIIIMGAALESGKITTAIWLHKNWSRADWRFKTYLVPALVSLMLLTSMGTFGFLSRAHLSQNIQTGDIQGQIDLINDQIKTQQDNINTAKATLAQLNSTVDQTLGRSTTEAGAKHAFQLRRSQSSERQALQKSITTAQEEILKLQNQRSPLDAKSRVVQAEVGPVKYVAALIYGDNPSSDLLERAVRWVIILIVAVFDPLAVVLVLAGAKQLIWAKQDAVAANPRVPAEIPIGLATTAVDEPKQPPQTQPSHDPGPGPAWLDLELDHSESLSANDQDQEFADQDPEPEVDWSGKVTELSAALAQAASNRTVLIDQHNQESIEKNRKIQDLNQQITRVSADLANAKTTAMALRTNLQQALTNQARLVEENQRLQQFKPVISETVSDSVPEPTLPPVVPDTVQPAQPMVQIEPAAAAELRPVAMAWGRSFPEDPAKGDLYLRLDFKPWKLFKWNDTSWMEIDRSRTDSLAYEPQYLEFLAESLAAGECQLDDLTTLEHQQLAIMLNDSLPKN